MTRSDKRLSIWKTLGALILAVLVSAPVGWAQSAAAQDEPDENTIRMNYSLYFENYRNKDYRAALPYLRWIIEHAPLFPQDDGRNFERAWKTYEQIALGEDDPDVRRKYLDSSLVMMETGMAMMDEEGVEYNRFSWIIDRGRFIQSYPEELADLQDEVLEDYREAFDLDPGRLDSYYVQYIVSQYREMNQRDRAIEFLEQAEPHHADNPEMVVWINRQRDTMFTDPDERIEWLEGQLASDPDNIEIMSQLADLYAQTDQHDRQRQMATRMVELRPSARGYMQLGQFHWSEGNLDEALSNYERALQLAEEPHQQRDLHYNIAIVHQERGRLQNARTSARRAIEVDRSFGPAYMLIGDLFVQAVQNQGSMDRRDKAVFWLVLDYYERARDADPSVAGRANSNIRTYRRYIPTQEDLFFEGWQPGSRYMINYGAYSWINEATTVRNP